eukprot:CAMPEP_0183567278 /NCGR_PEP_ID=MMETSP0371-20130417/113863_1 /TAXON_ID=268820 /ORGANISM="Peridinium aciculiferum, Strain PAER-2" /LENGTH=69 /DNA_ID=CAMNT_0025776635 /DNA_START=181 /DNA_END=386 /DNA_ORIENTATION=-
MSFVFVTKALTDLPDGWHDCFQTVSEPVFEVTHRELSTSMLDHSANQSATLKGPIVNIGLAFCSGSGHL